MASISEEQKSQIIGLLQLGHVSREEIAARAGVSPGTMSAIKAHISMGTYGEPASEIETNELIEAAEAPFGLERDLQLALRSDIEQLESGLCIIDDGKERMTEAGRIDITAQDTQNVIVVIELKAGTAAPEALTQLLAYMSAVSQQDQRSVRGVLIAGDFHPRVVFAARAVPNVQLRRYRFKLTFESVG
jgi:hypothetical protein